MFSSKCVREKSNLSQDNPKYKFDSTSFQSDVLKTDLEIVSPKAVTLLNKIKELDENDLKNENKLFKHFIFCDVKSKKFGIQFLASCFIMNGFQLGYNTKQEILQESKLIDRKYNNFFLLTSLDVYNKPLSVKTKKNILKIMNQRPDNIHGRLSRFILMDSGFKEGIDLFDIKYIHIFEPSVNDADMKQVIGRSTRTCGQKGLHFIPGIGWPLYVYIYDISIPKNVSKQFLNSTTLYELYLKTLNIDVREIYFTNDLQKVSIRSSVDYTLNKNLHDFKIQKGGGTHCSNLSQASCQSTMGCIYANGKTRQFCRTGTKKTKSTNICSKKNKVDCENLSDECIFVNKNKLNYCRKRKTKKIKNKRIQSAISSLTKSNSFKNDSAISSLTKSNSFKNDSSLTKSNSFKNDSSLTKSNSFKNDSSLTKSNSFKNDSAISSLTQSEIYQTEIPIINKMSHEELEKFIEKYFQKSKWGDVEIENGCGNETIKTPSTFQKGGNTLIQYTPTQQFVSDYFKPSTFVKGMLLWHSVGTGKTCSAISTATTNFETNGYTILWVTRTTLKEDIWKNMFEQICHKIIRNYVMKGNKIPDTREERMKLLSRAWKIRPLSYKQFTNLVGRKNKYYEDLVRINGKEDPLRKTLLIIDEAHKLYGGNDLSGIERPNMTELKEAIMKSYITSGKDSVRLLLMTATPITVNSMELIKLLNLCKPPTEQMPETFEEFGRDYLTETGIFSEKGKEKYMNDITGILSYLNREFDVRQFAQPIVENIITEMKIGALQEHNSLKETQKIKNNEFIKFKQEPLFHLTLKNFNSLLKKCDQIKTKKIHLTCKKNIKEKIKDILKKITEYKKSIFKEYQDDIKQLNLKTNKKHVLNDDKKTMYYNLIDKCNVHINKMNQISGVQENLQTIIDLKKEIQLLKKQRSIMIKTKEDTIIIDRNIQDKLKMIDEIKRDIKFIKKDYKTDLKEKKKEETQLNKINDIEEYYKEDIEYVSDELRDFMTQWKAEIDDIINEIEEEYQEKKVEEKEVEDDDDVQLEIKKIYEEYKKEKEKKKKRS